MNSVHLVGHVGQDPELRLTGSGEAICNVSLATTERRKQDDHTEWHKLVCFGKTAEIATQYAKKGKLIGIQGRLSTRKWQDKNGQDRWTTEILVDRLELLGGPSGKGEARSASTEERQPQQPAAADPFDDNIPF